MAAHPSLTAEVETAPRPAFASIDGWCAISGMGRRVTYHKLGTGELKAIKLGARTLVDVQHGLTYLRSLPPAKIRPMPPRKASRQTATLEQPAT